MRGTAWGSACQGTVARLVRVQALVQPGLARTILVGLPDAGARESRDRLPAALAASGFDYPSRRVLFNLAPSRLRKEGAPLDLALAVALLVATGQIPPPRQRILLIGELDLEGRLSAERPGALLGALAATEAGFRYAIAPAATAPEAALAPGLAVLVADDLADAVAAIADPSARAATKVCPPSVPVDPLRLEDVRGQEQARRAGILAAAGGHHLLLEGPPGSGKSLLARRIAPLLPELEPSVAMELAKLEASLGPVRQLPTQPPFRAPHHTVSVAGLLGGGVPLRPGELSRAHGGVLFLDELLEFQRPALEGLRQPLEEGELRIQRARETALFPAAVQLVAAMNPCPCGYAGHAKRPCSCTPQAVERYRHRLSGPLLDRFDLRVEFGAVPAARMQGPPTEPTTETARALIRRALDQQRERRDAGGPTKNATATLEQALGLFSISAAARQLLSGATDRFALSGRAQLRLLRVARTIADVEGREELDKDSMLEALLYRGCHLDGGVGPSNGVSSSMTAT